jgi:2-C-methyl-D-erythritol 4-phosphate cytidylyltransferase
MGGVKKEYRPLGPGAGRDGKPLTVLGGAVSAFTASPRIGLIVIAVPADPDTGESAARKNLPLRFLQPDASPNIVFVPGGRTRRASVHRALALLAPYHPDYVVIHDGARPWLDAPLLERLLDEVPQRKAVIPILPLIETPKEIDEQGLILRHLKRRTIGTAQTPQAFAYPAILYAHEQAAERELRDRAEYTDDAEVWGEFVGPVSVIPGSPANRKITFPEDLPGPGDPR